MTFEVLGEVADTEDDEVEVVVVRGSGPGRRPGGLLGNDPLDEAVGAVGKCRTVFSDGTVDETQVLEEHQLPVRVQPVERFVPGNSQNWLNKYCYKKVTSLFPLKGEGREYSWLTYCWFRQSCCRK